LFEELDVQHAAAEPDVFQIPAHPGRSPRFLESKLENPDAAVFVADLADTIIGVAIVRLSAAPETCPCSAPAASRTSKTSSSRNGTAAPEWALP
jgi:hypothetical protein